MPIRNRFMNITQLFVVSYNNIFRHGRSLALRNKSV